MRRAKRQSRKENEGTVNCSANSPQTPREARYRSRLKKKDPEPCSSKASSDVFEFIASPAVLTMTETNSSNDSNIWSPRSKKRANFKRACAKASAAAAKAMARLPKQSRNRKKSNKSKSKRPTYRKRASSKKKDESSGTKSPFRRKKSVDTSPPDGLLKELTDTIDQGADISFEQDSPNNSIITLSDVSIESINVSQIDTAEEGYHDRDKNSPIPVSLLDSLNIDVETTKEKDSDSSIKSSPFSPIRQDQSYRPKAHSNVFNDSKEQHLHPADLSTDCEDTVSLVSNSFCQDSNAGLFSISTNISSQQDMNTSGTDSNKSSPGIDKMEEEEREITMMTDISPLIFTESNGITILDGQENPVSPVPMRRSTRVRRTVYTPSHHPTSSFVSAQTPTLASSSLTSSVYRKATTPSECLSFSIGTKSSASPVSPVIRANNNGFISSLSGTLSKLAPSSTTCTTTCSISNVLLSSSPSSDSRSISTLMTSSSSCSSSVKLIVNPLSEGSIYFHRPRRGVVSPGILRKSIKRRRRHSLSTAPRPAPLASNSTVRVAKDTASSKRMRRTRSSSRLRSSSMNDLTSVSQQQPTKRSKYNTSKEKTNRLTRSTRSTRRSTRCKPRKEEKCIPSDAEILAIKQANAENLSQPPPLVVSSTLPRNLTLDHITNSSNTGSPHYLSKSRDIVFDLPAQRVGKRKLNVSAWDWYHQQDSPSSLASLSDKPRMAMTDLSSAELRSPPSKKRKKTKLMHECKRLRFRDHVLVRTYEPDYSLLTVPQSGGFGLGLSWRASEEYVEPINKTGGGGVDILFDHPVIRIKLASKKKDNLLTNYTLFEKTISQDRNNSNNSIDSIESEESLQPNRLNFSDSTSNDDENTSDTSQLMELSQSSCHQVDLCDQFCFQDIEEGYLEQEDLHCTWEVKKRHPSTNSSEKLERILEDTRKKRLIDHGIDIDDDIIQKANTQSSLIRDSRLDHFCDCKPGECATNPDCTCCKSGIRCHVEGKFFCQCRAGPNGCGNPEGQYVYVAQKIRKARRDVLRKVELFGTEAFVDGEPDQNSEGPSKPPSRSISISSDSQAVPILSSANATPTTTTTTTTTSTTSTFSQASISTRPRRKARDVKWTPHMKGNYKG